MDIIEIFLESHAAMRGQLEALEAPFSRAHGVGWDDCVAVDQKRLSKDIYDFIESFKRHEREEDEFLSGVSGLLNLDAETLAAIAEGRRSLGEFMKLLGAVAFTCDGEHVHRVRELISRLRTELEPYLAYEENTLFPLFRERLPARLLLELGREARMGAAGGPSRL